MAKRKLPEKTPGLPEYRDVQVGDVLDPHKWNSRNMPGPVIVLPCKVLEVSHQPDITYFRVMTDRGERLFSAEWFKKSPKEA